MPSEKRSVSLNDFSSLKLVTYERRLILEKKSGAAGGCGGINCFVIMIEFCGWGLAFCGAAVGVGFIVIVIGLLACPCVKIFGFDGAMRGGFETGRCELELV